MADRSSIFSTIFRKLAPKGRLEHQAVPPPGSSTESSSLKAEAAAPIISETELRSLDSVQLEAFLTRQPERAILKVLGSLTDLTLQLRVIEGVHDEAVLKRISRSQLDKKIRRIADRKLKETGSSGMELRLQKLTPLNERMQNFLRTPDWERAQELLLRVTEPDLLGGPVDENSSLFRQFQELRGRLKREVEAFERTSTEMEELCLQLDPSRNLSKENRSRIQERFKDLTEKYSFPKNFKPLQTFDEALAARAHRPAPTAEVQAIPEAPALVAEPPVVFAPTLSPVKRPERSEQELLEEKVQSEKKELQHQADRETRLAHIHSLLNRLQEVKDNLAHRQAGPVLRELQAEATALRRWRREFPEKLTEIDELLKTLSSKRTEVVEEARWEAWARTDLAVRIQKQLEKLITSLETETDPVIALQNSIGLTGQLHDYAKELKELGSLERGKDHKIWQQFKSLSDRGWAVCDRMRGLVLERVKAVLSEHATQPIEFTSEALSKPSGAPTFKSSAFEDDVPAQIKELRALWIEIGSRPSDANRELEAVFTRLFEQYFRQINLQQGKIQRVENTAIQTRRELLNEMKIACEGKSTLPSRAKVALGIAERWIKAPEAASVAIELQSEFEGYQARLAAELSDTAEQHLLLTSEVRTRVQELLEKIKNGKSPGSTATKEISGLELELQGIEKQIVLFTPLQPPLPALNNERRVTAALLQDCRDAVTRQVQERSQARIRVLEEMEKLAITTEWETAPARFEELRNLWKSSAGSSQTRDAALTALFDNSSAFHQSRFASRENSAESAAKADQRKKRRELIYSLEALTRFRKPKAGAKQTPPLPLPFSEEEVRQFASGKLLELGMKYQQILSLDPTAGVLKETRKIMDQWSKLGMTDEDTLPSFWKYYLDRVHTLLEP